MIEVTKIVEWDMAHRVPNHESKCYSLHGHRYRLHLTIGGPLIDIDGDSSEGMVYDFSHIKRIMMEKIHDALDHGCMYYIHDKILSVLLTEHFNSCKEPDKDWLLIPVPFIPTAENIAKWCYDQMKDEFPQGIKISKIRLFETPNSWADYIPE